ncbi:hypothetical protein FRC01_002325, partial [Tulasnella sp. 417]
RKRLRLDCDRRRPCGRCSSEGRDCKHDSGALTDMDFEAVHDTVVRHQHLLEGLTNLLGIPEEEVQMMKDQTFPSCADYAGLTIDVDRVQAVLGIRNTRSRESIARSNPAVDDLFASVPTERDALLPPAIVAFSRPPPQIPDPHANIPGGRRPATSTEYSIPSYILNLATCVFQANSIAVSHHALAQLQLWQRVLGWEPRPAHRSSTLEVPINPAGAAAANADEGEEEEEEAGGRGYDPPRADSTVSVAAPPSETEYYDHLRPKDLSVLALAHELFIMPAIAAEQQAGGGPNILSSHVPYNISLMDLGSSSASTSSSHPASFSGSGPSFVRTFSPLSLGSSSASTCSSQPPPSTGSGVPQVANPFPSVSPSPSILPLISPQVVLWYLPTQPWARAFMKEFDLLMITHDGIGASEKILKARIESMFEWANESMKRLGSADGPDSDSKYSWSSPSSTDSQRKGSIPRNMGRGRSAKMEMKSLPPPPTLGLFAVACAVYALGALSYECKSIHGRSSEDRGKTPEHEPSRYFLLHPYTHPLPEKATSTNLFNLARAALLVHDESALPPSLDYLHAHMLTWLYLLHPSDCVSRVTSCGFQGSSTGVGSGGMTVVEQRIYKELGKCVSVAREMGLDLVDQPNNGRMGGAFGSSKVKGSEDGKERMGIWEKEMRRRVWWQLMMFDHVVRQISDNLGRLPLIPLRTYACNPPSATKESEFGPTSPSIPDPMSNNLNTTYFAEKCRLLRIIKTLSYTRLEGDLTLDLAKQIDAQVSNWRSTLPAQYKIDFREKPDDTVFPDLDTVDVQACDLHILANVFLLRLWLPFFNEALSSSSRSSRGVLLTATTAANAIIVASHHLVARFWRILPMSFAHYDFGNSLWLATGILASVATMRSDERFSSTARSGVKMATALFEDQVVEGKLDLELDHVPKYEVNEIMNHIARLVDEVAKEEPGAGSKRKLDEGVDQMKMRHGCPIPYFGTAALASETHINMPQAQDATPPQAASAPLRTLVNQQADETSGSSSDWASHRHVPQFTRSRRRILSDIRNRRTLPFAARSTSSISSGRVPSYSSYSRARAPGSDVSSTEDSLSSHSPRNPTYTLPSSDLKEHPMPSPSSRPSTVQPPTIHQSSPLNPIFHRNPSELDVQQLRGSSLNSESENSLAAVDLSHLPLRVPPDTNPNPISQSHRAFTSTPYPPNGQVQLPPNGALDETDSRPQSPSSEPYGTSASVLPQTDVSAASPPADAWLTDLPAPGGPSRQPESYGPATSGSYLSTQNNLWGPDIYEMLPISADNPFDTQATNSSHLPPIMEEEPGEPLAIYLPENNTSVPSPDVT